MNIRTPKVKYLRLKKNTVTFFTPSLHYPPTMAKKDASAAIRKAAAAAASSSSTTSSITTSTPSTASSGSNSIREVISAINLTYKDYTNTLTPRLKLIDLFLVFLVLLGILQFVYVILIGNFPFNAFLGGFISCVGQFVLVVSLRLQYNSSESTKQDQLSEKEDDTVESQVKVFDHINPERAFGDFIFASLILHFLVYHFIN